MHLEIVSGKIALRLTPYGGAVMTVLLAGLFSACIFSLTANAPWTFPPLAFCVEGGIILLVRGIKRHPGASILGFFLIIYTIVSRDWSAERANFHIVWEMCVGVCVALLPMAFRLFCDWRKEA